MPLQRGERGDINRSFAYPWYQENVEWVLEWAHGARRALEFGCGVGWLTACLTEAGIDTLGIDIAPDKIAMARMTHPEARFETLEMTPDTFPAGSFDFIVSNQVLEHIAQLDEVLAMLHEAACPRARAFFSVPNGHGLYCLLYDKLAVRLGRHSEHRQLLGLRGWRSVLESHGFRIVRVLTQNVLPYRLFPKRMQDAAADLVHAVNRRLCDVTPSAWASAFFFCLERCDR